MSLKIQFNKWFWLCILPGAGVLLLAERHQIFWACCCLGLMCIFAEKSGKYIASGRGGR